MTRTRDITAEQLPYVSPPHKSTELVRGQLIVREPPGSRHGNLAAKVLVAIGIYLHTHPVGELFAAETGFTLQRKPDTVRAPDVAFIRNERLPNPIPVGYPELAPDLVVEVLSPSDRAGMALAKVGDWLDAGAALVWVIDPARKTARVYRADGSERLLDAADTLSGEELLPGFELPLATLFD